MDQLEDKVNSIVRELDKLDVKRETLFREARSLNRLSGKGIALILQKGNYKPLIEDGKLILDKINELMAELSYIVSWNSISSEVEEYSEFVILASIIETGEISTDNGNIPPNVWLSSLGDVVGELRRIVLKSIIDNEIDKALKQYETMNKISFLLRGLAYSKTLVPNLRRKIDMVRAVTEKTDSDITNALIFHKLNQRIGRSDND